jgi:glycosyltransferase involved in cell wall biosynthesis
MATLKDGKTGVLADTPLEQAEASLHLLDNPKLATRLGRAAHTEVARRYLVTHQLAGYLKLLRQATAKRPLAAIRSRSR